MPAKTTIALALLLILASAGIVVAQENNLTRQSALSELKKCTSNPNKYPLDCTDFAVFLIDLYEKGDLALLHPLFDAGLKSDGALSEVLGPFYADVLQRQTKDFLILLSERPRKAKEIMALLAISADGGGNGKEWNNDVRFRLNKIRHTDKKLSPTAKIVLDQLKSFLAQEH